MNMSLIRQQKKNKKKTTYEIQNRHRGKQPNQIEKPKLKNVLQNQ